MSELPGSGAEEGRATVKTLPAPDLPANVQKALTARAGAAKITKVESLTRQSELVDYEAATLNGTKRGEIQVGPEGGRLTHEE